MRKSQIKDLTGQKFGRLTVLKLDHLDNKHKSFWLCECSCEEHNQKIVKGTYLIQGSTKSCGCLKKEILSTKAGKASIKFNISNVSMNLPYRKKLYDVWKNIRHRCYNKKNKHYKWYGARGIVICDEWLNKEKGFYNFYHWAINNGYKEGLSIDRNDVNGNYCPQNCTWETQKEQCNNKTDNILITYKNKTLTASQWIDELSLENIDSDTIRKRWKNRIRGKLLFKPINMFSQKLIEINGEIKTSKEWYTEYNISHKQFKSRYEKGIRGIDLIKSTRQRATKEKPRIIYKYIEVTMNKETKTLEEWAYSLNMSFDTIRDRYKSGIRGEDLFSKKYLKNR